MGPQGYALLGGDLDAYRPIARVALDDECMALTFPIALQGRVESVSDYSVDSAGNTFAAGTFFAPVLRIGATFDSARSFAPIGIRAEYEHDLVTGSTASEPSLGGTGYPHTDGVHHELRKALVRFSLGYALHVSAGVTTSHFGLGLLANDGNHGWTPGSARFADPRGGDRVLRLALATGPHTSAKITALIGADRVIDDDVLLTSDELDTGADDDEAYQFVGAVIVGLDEPTSGGAYIARRHQEAADGAETNVWAFDLTGQTTIEWKHAVLTLATEMALISGKTQLAPSTDFPEHDVLQFGLGFRSTLDLGKVGAAFDVLYASGDQNLDDDVQNAFRPDPNFDMGLIAFRHVLAAQTARAVATASDPGLVGVPSDDIERLPTRGSPTNTLALFPRLRFRPIDGLEAYGGPLFAFAATRQADPLNTRLLGGGDPTTALGAESGRYLGTEYDLGVRYSGRLYGSEFSVGVEGGVFRPGSALRGPPGNPMDDSIYVGRGLLTYKL